MQVLLNIFHSKRYVHYETRLRNCHGTECEIRTVDRKRPTELYCSIVFVTTLSVLLTLLAFMTEVLRGFTGLPHNRKSGSQIF